MTLQNATTTITKPARKGGLTTGIILITIGLGLLVSRWLPIDYLFPLALGLGFIIAGIARRSAGLLIPGGIIGGAGLATLVMENNWFAPMGSVAAGGVFLITMSLGWFAIIVLSKLFTADPQIWPIFPGLAMAIIGALVLMGERGLKILEIAGFYWPLILVAVGLSILYRWWKERR